MSGLVYSVFEFLTGYSWSQYFTGIYGYNSGFYIWALLSVIIVLGFFALCWFFVFKLFRAVFDLILGGW